MSTRIPRPLLSGLLIVLAALIGVGLISAKADEPKVGQPAPNFALKGLDGKTVELSALLEDGPVALVVLRGFPGYQCPICNQQVLGLLRAQNDLEAAGAQVVLIYPGPSDQLQAKAEEFLGSKTLPDSFSFLIDPDYRFTNAYGLRWDQPRETAYPSAFVIDEDGKITYAKISRSHGGRAPASELVQALEQLN